FFSSRRRHTRFSRDWSSDVCSSDLSATVGRVLTVYPRNAICRAVACREMADGGVLFSGVFEILNRRHRVSDPDPDSGTFKLQDRSEERRVGKEHRYRAWLPPPK